MKQHRTDHPDFLEALEDNDRHSASSRRQIERKTQQFCRQVQRALNLALATAGLYVEEVLPAPDCGRLLVYVGVPAGQPVDQVLAMLSRQTPGLRAEVAAAITRKRSPELCFVPVCADGSDDDE